MNWPKQNSAHQLLLNWLSYRLLQRWLRLRRQRPQSRTPRATLKTVRHTVETPA